MTEYLCDANEIKDVQHKCPYGCQFGRCVIPIFDVNQIQLLIQNLQALAVSGDATIVVTLKGATADKCEIDVSGTTQIIDLGKSKTIANLQLEVVEIVEIDGKLACRVKNNGYKGGSQGVPGGLTQIIDWLRMIYQAVTG